MGQRLHGLHAHLIRSLHKHLSHPHSTAVVLSVLYDYICKTGFLHPMQSIACHSAAVVSCNPVLCMGFSHATLSRGRPHDWLFYSAHTLIRAKCWLSRIEKCCSRGKGPGKQNQPVGTNQAQFISSLSLAFIETLNKVTK